MVDAPKVVTLGCRLNSFESEIMRRQAADAGLTDVILINSCAVTAEAERQTRQSIRRARRDNPTSRIIVSGCAAQIDPAKFAAMDEVDFVVGNQEKLQAETYVDLPKMPICVADIGSANEAIPDIVDGLENRTRAVIEVQTGCDHRCTFCIIPFGRGPSRSVSADRIIVQLQRLVDLGCREVVVSGVDIASYGDDLPGAPRLGEMLQQVFAAVPDLPRLRLSSLDPAAIDPALLDLIGGEPRLMPHLHLSIQAGDDMVLKRMKRRHNRDQVIELVNETRRRRPDIVFGADFIAGFPTETDLMHENGMELVRECDLIYLHVFPYSERNGTPAARMPSVPVPIRRIRAAEMRALGAMQLKNYLTRQTGARIEILAETETRGRSRHYASVKLAHPVLPGRLVAVDIIGTEDGALVGAPA